MAEKNGKERSCSLGRDDTGNIVNFALTRMSWIPEKCISPFFHQYGRQWGRDENEHISSTYFYKKHGSQI
jgi:hypothetical protein